MALSKENTESPAMKESEKIQNVDIPVIDLAAAADRGAMSKAIVKACEEFGFFYIINHGVAPEIIESMEEEGRRFFARPTSEKERAGPAKPFGYGCKYIGPNGDVGELEYILLHTNHHCISEKSKTISDDPTEFRLSSYIEAVREVACQALELIAEGLGVSDASIFRSLLGHVDNDSLFRINHYFPASDGHDDDMSTRLGIGAHTDPQILTILRSNGVGGLQLSVEDGVWIPVRPDPSAFCANVGDLLQAMTNGRFQSVKHRVVTTSLKSESRLSIMYFGAPPLHADIAVLPELVSPEKPSVYRAFTWGDYKQVVYSLRLRDCRLHRFMIPSDDQVA